jgi:hypothetical protein
MSEWWWIVLAALAIIVAMEFVIMRRRDAVSDDGSVIDSVGDYPSRAETGLPGGMIDDGRTQERDSSAQDRNRRVPKHPPGAD